MTALDLDELIAFGQVKADAEAVKHARLRLLAQAADAAFRSDPLMLIPLVEASHAAVRIQRERLENHPPRAKKSVLTSEQRARRLERHREYRRERQAQASTEATA